jgi:pimeloyl-ACP methyl ester carboxylesterase
LLYDWLKQQHAEAQIVVFGRSLGSGIAAWVASKNRPRLLILDSPYFSFYHNIRRYIFFLPVKWLMRYDLRTDQFLHSVGCPVHIIHGRRDHLIPFRQSEQLKALHPGKVHLHPVEKAHHNNLPDFPEFYELLYDILYVRPN